MAIYKDLKGIADVRKGNDGVSAVYKGNDLVYSKGTPVSQRGTVVLEYTITTPDTVVQLPVLAMEDRSSRTLRINWGDGITEDIAVGVINVDVSTATSHSYSEPGVYIVTLSSQNQTSMALTLGNLTVQDRSTLTGILWSGGVWLGYLISSSLYSYSTETGVGVYVYNLSDWENLRYISFENSVFQSRYGSSTVANTHRFTNLPSLEQINFGQEYGLQNSNIYILDCPNISEPISIGGLSYELRLQGTSSCPSVTFRTQEGRGYSNANVGAMNLYKTLFTGTGTIGSFSYLSIPAGDSNSRYSGIRFAFEYAQGVQTVSDFQCYFSEANSSIPQTLPLSSLRTIVDDCKSPDIATVNLTISAENKATLDNGYPGWRTIMAGKRYNII